MKSGMWITWFCFAGNTNYTYRDSISSTLHRKAVIHGSFIHVVCLIKRHNHKLLEPDVISIFQTCRLWKCRNRTAVSPRLIYLGDDNIWKHNAFFFLFIPNSRAFHVSMNLSLTIPFTYFYCRRHPTPTRIVNFYSYFIALSASFFLPSILLF